jgi:transposase
MPLASLPNIKTISRDEAGDQLRFVVESNATPLCPHCQSSRLHRWTPKKGQEFKDVPVDGKSVIIQINRKRWKCVDCGKTFLETLDWIDPKRAMTKALVLWLKTQHGTRPNAQIAKEAGIDPKMVKIVAEE